MLTFLPACIAELNHLLSLTLIDNHLRSIPHAMKYMKSIRRINLSGNEIAIYPVWLLENKSLTSLEMFDNPCFQQDLTLN
jgi:Leucine-rich repeat (LRR) protein